MKSKKQKLYIRHIDRAMTTAGAIHPLTALPQIITIYASQNADGVSLVTWLGFMLIGSIFLTYGIAHNLRPFIINQVIWFVIDFAVVVGIILF